MEKLAIHFPTDEELGRVEVVVARTIRRRPPTSETAWIDRGKIEVAWLPGTHPAAALVISEVFAGARPRAFLVVLQRSRGQEERLQREHGPGL